MPVYPKPKAQQWIQQEPSVLESPAARGLRTAAQWLGMGDDFNPADAVNPMEMPLAGLVSFFRNKAARQLSTRDFLSSAEDLASDKLMVSARKLAARWPRVAAHLRFDRYPRDLGGADAAITTGSGGPAVMPISFGEDTFRNMDNLPQGELNNIVFHEGTHAAQALGNSDMGDLYDNASTLVGYDRNPFEVAAYDRGMAAEVGSDRASTWGLGAQKPKAYQAMLGLENVANQHANTPEGQQIKAILDRRRGKQ